MAVFFEVFAVLGYWINRSLLYINIAIIIQINVFVPLGIMLYLINKTPEQSEVLAVLIFHQDQINVKYMYIVEFPSNISQF
jgi:hypothetical protein